MSEADPVLGFSIDLIRNLAERAEAVHVIANEVRGVPYDLEECVSSLGKEHGTPRLIRGIRYQRLLFSVSKALNPTSLLAHMCPVYLNQAGPFAKSHGMRLLLWFAHPSRRYALALAEHLADVVLTSLPGAYPGAPANLRAIGQAINVDRFDFRAPRERSGDLRLLALGRTSPVKGFVTAIEAVGELRRLGVPVRLRIVGPSSNKIEVKHRRELSSLISHLQLENDVELVDGTRPDLVPEAIAECDALLNPVVAGAGDKVAFEAMAIGRPVFCSNPAFSELLEGLPIELRYRENDAGSLARRVFNAFKSDYRLLVDLGIELRRRVIASHSIGHWTDAVLEAAAGQ